MNIVFHRREPIEVRSKNMLKLYLDIPAGIEIRLRSIGMNRQMKIDFPPSSLNTSMEFNILSSFNFSK